MLCFVHTWGSCWALCTLDHAVYCFPLFFLVGLGARSFGLTVEGLGFAGTDLLGFFGNLLGFQWKYGV